MTSRAATIAFQGIEAVPVDVQAQFLSGMVAFNVVGLGDKAVAESRERVRAALHAIGLALPGKRLVVNLSPADLPKEGSHYDLPITLAVLAALGNPPPRTVLAIGDSPEHDIAGAAGAGLDSVLLRTGILSDKDDTSLQARLPKGARRVFCLSELRW